MHLFSLLRQPDIVGKHPKMSEPFRQRSCRPPYPWVG